MDKKMKKSFLALVSRSLLALTLVLTCGSAGAEDAPVAPQLQKLKHTVLSPTSEQVVLQLNGSYSPKIFTLKDENPRLIFDFADMTHGRDVQGITTTKGAIVKRVRVGMHTVDAPKTRIVFDVATFKGLTYTQKFDENSSSLVIQFTRTGKTAAPQQREDASATVSAPETAASPGAPGEPETASAQAEQPPAPQQPASPGHEEKSATRPPQPEPPQPAEQTTAPAKEVPAGAPEKTAKAEAAAPPAPVKPMADAAAEPEEQAMAPMAAAKPEEPAGETVAPPAGKDEGKKSETAGGEKQRPGTATASQAAAPAGTDKSATAKPEVTKPAALAATSERPQLEYVKFDASSPKGEMVLFKLNGFHPPAVRGVEEGIPRVICEFNNTKLIGKTKNPIKTDGKFVKVIRTSATKKPERVRVVIDLEPNRSYDLQQVFFKEDNLFVLIVNTVKK